MKKTLLFLLFLLFSNNLKAQNAFYDALYCSSLLPDDAEPQKYTDLSVLGGADTLVLRQLKNFLNKPFKNPKPNMERVKTIFKKINSAQQVNITASGFGGTELLSILSPIFNLSKLSTNQVDTLLYGLTIYFADEFRKGYMQTYMKGFENSIGKVGELQVFFPSSYNKFRNFDPIRYKELGNEMKTIFDADLSNLLTNFRNHIHEPDTAIHHLMILTPTYCETIRSQRLYPFLGISADIGEKLIRGVHPSDIISSLDNEYYELDDKNLFKKFNLNTSSMQLNEMKNFSKTLHLANILQRNLRDTSSQKWGVT